MCDLASNIQFDSYSCLINEGNTFLLTGGSRTIKNSRYDSNGWVEDIGYFNTARTEHGCTRFRDNSGVMVGKESSKIVESTA